MRRNQEVQAYRLENDKGCNYLVTWLGRRSYEYVTPDKEDQFTNNILGFDRFGDCILQT